MPYLTAPPWAKIADRIILAFTYIAVAGMGSLAALFRDDPALSLVGWVVLAASVPCMVGAAAGRWEIEAISLPVLISAVLASMVMIDVGPRHIVLWMMLALAGALSRQWLRLLLQIIADLRRRRMLHRLDDGGPA